MPAADQQPEFYTALAGPGRPVMAVPHMGTHWVDVRSPELQGALGHPENARTFTTTFLHGSWDGQFIFAEPMVTRAFILGRKSATTAASQDSVMTLPVATRFGTAGYSPAAYHVAFDAKSGEYRVALSQLAWRQ